MNSSTWSTTASTASSPRPEDRGLPTPDMPFTHELSAENKKLIKAYRTECAGFSASILATGVSYPLDFLKSRMQSFGTPFSATVKDAYKQEGLRAFWRGVGSPLISVAVVRTSALSIYQKGKYFTDRQITELTGKSPLAMANAPGSYPNLYTVACFAPAGAVSGAVVTFASCPFELVKLNEQLAGKLARDNAMQGDSAATTKRNAKTGGALRKMWSLCRNGGPSRLYAGFRLHLLRDLIGTSIYFTTYETVKQTMGNARGNSPTSPAAVILAGGSCGIMSWAVVCRHLVLRK